LRLLPPEEPHSTSLKIVGLINVLAEKKKNPYVLCSTVCISNSSYSNPNPDTSSIPGLAGATPSESTLQPGPAPAPEQQQQHQQQHQQQDVMRLSGYHDWSAIFNPPAGTQVQPQQPTQHPGAPAPDHQHQQQQQSGRVVTTAVKERVNYLETKLKVSSSRSTTSRSTLTRRP
jgi:hypothetical protein